MNDKRQKKKRLAALFALTMTFATPNAFAACSSPVGNGGDIVFSSNTNLMAYCDGSSWIQIGNSLTLSFGTLTTSDFCLATSGTNIACTTAAMNLTTQTTGALPVANGGTGLTSITTKGIIYGQGGSASIATSAGSQYNVLVAGSGGTPAFGQVALNQSAAVTGTLGVSNGGIGVTSLTQYGLIVGNGASAFSALGVGASSTILIGNTGINPSFSSSPKITNLTISGAAVLGFATDYSTTGLQQDVAINTSSAVRYIGTADATFYGIVAGSAGQILHIHNASTKTITLSNQSSSEATAANRINTGTGSDLLMPSDTSAVLQYDVAAGRWRVAGFSRGSGPGGINTSVQFNNSSFGGDSTFTWDYTNEWLSIGGTTTPAATTGTIAGVTVNIVPQVVSLNGGRVMGGGSISGATVGQLAYYTNTATIAGTPDITISGTATTINGPALVAFNGTDITTTGAHQDIAANTYSSIRYSGLSNATWYGIVAGSPGQLLNIHNASSSTLTLSNQSSSETTSANRIITGNGDMAIPANSSVTLQYDNIASRWRVVQGSAGSAGTAPAGTTGQVQFASGTNNGFSASANFTWNATNSKLGIGTATPSQALSLAGHFDLQGANGYLIEVPNSGSGTTANKLAKLDSTGSAVLASAGDADGTVGIVVAGAGTTGSAQIAIGGQVSCVFDNATTAGHYVGISTSVAGDCTDVGASRQLNKQTIGRVMSTNGSAGTYLVLIQYSTPGTTCNAGTTTVFLTTGTSWTVPSCWNSSNNTIEVIGGGGGGGHGQNGVSDMAAGGGGAYSKITNLSLTSNTSISYSVGAGGVGSTSSNVAGTVGGDTWFNGSTLATSSVGAKGGSGGNSSNGLGGASGSGVGTIKYSGGDGSNSTTDGGGGGAAGPSGAGGKGGGWSAAGTNGGAGGGGANGGAAGTNNTSTPGSGASGGGNGGTGGTGGSTGTDGTVGANGTTWDASHGPGGGGGAGGSSSGSSGGAGANGGLYGGGGGTGGRNSGGGQANPGQGAQGIIVITYTN